MDCYTELASMLLAAKNGQQVDRERVAWLATRCENDLAETVREYDFCDEEDEDVLRCYIEERGQIYTKLAAARKELGL